MKDESFFSIIDDSEGDETHNDRVASGHVWNILIVDDEKVVHEATRLAISHEYVFGSPIVLHHAFSAAEAMEKIRSNVQFSVAFIDVVMEKPDSGLKLVEKIRAEGLNELRIVLRTGQPGYAPEISVLTDFDINDYRTKNELTKNKLLSVLLSSIRSYIQIQSLKKARSGLELIVEASSDLFQEKNLEIFGKGVLTQISAILCVKVSGFLSLSSVVSPSINTFDDFNILCGTGKYCDVKSSVMSVDDEFSIKKVFSESKEKDIVIQGRHSIGIYIKSSFSSDAFIYIDCKREIGSEDIALLKIFGSNISAVYTNINLIKKLDQVAFKNLEVGIPNMNAMRKRINRLLSQGRSDFYLVIIHPESLAKLNSLFGIKAVENIFIQTNNLLLDTFNEANLVALSSWGDFIILLDKSDYNRKKLESFNSYSITLNNNPIQMMTTLASAQALPHENSAEQVIQRANLTLLLAKEYHRGKLTEYSPDVIDDQKKRISIYYYLSETFKSGKPVVEVYIQAKYDSLNKKVVGAEALSRLKMNDQYISPVIFIPLLEESGFSDNLLELLFFEISKWQVERRAKKLNIFPVSVNLTMKDIHQVGYSKKLLSMVNALNITPDDVEFEITEGAMMHNLEQTITELENIRSHGFRIAVDDFGTGYSSLSYLDQLPVDTLKIDKAFVDRLTPINARNSIVATIIGMADSLRMDVIAEGVETQEQAQALQFLGCNICQGYLYSKPIKIDLFNESDIGL
jgi:EAL domain-containing protein (putative c-di-GMP-specific phosphodiesterase class I)/CheY-like chemotaxis protein